jgi:hypothetical protein
MRHRWWYLSGVGFSVLLFAGILLAMGTYPEDDKAPDADWLKVISSSSDRAKIIIGAYAVFVAGLLFLWFASSMRSAFDRESNEESNVLAHVSAASGVVFVTMLMLGVLAIASVPGSITFGDSPIPAADFARQLTQLGTGFMLAPGSLVAALYVASTSRLGAVSGVLSRPVVVFGYVAAVLLLFGFLFLPFLALPLWTLVAGISLARGRDAKTATNVPVTSPVPAHSAA